MIRSGMVDPRPAPIATTLSLPALIALAAFAVFTILYDLALVVPFSLRAVTVTWIAACTILVACCWSRLKSAAKRAAADRYSAALLAMCLITAAVALLTNRPDDDDSFYLSRAVLNWENWGRPIAALYPFAFTSGAGGLFPSLPSWEHLLAGIAALIGMQPIDIYHRVAPAACGFLLPMSWFACLRRFGQNPRSALVGCAAIMVLMLLDGTTHRGIAYFGLLRIWQGKVLLVWVLAPVALVAMRDALELGRSRDWLGLALVGVAGIGLSTSAAFFLPVLVGVAGGTFCLAYRPHVPLWRAPASAVAVFLYSAFCVLPLSWMLVGPAAIFASPIAHDFDETVALVYGVWWSPTVLAALVGIVGLLLARRLRDLAWFGLWAAAISAPLAWKPSAEFIAHYLTSTDALWRLAYAAPAIVIIGMGFAALSDLACAKRLMPAVIGAGAVAAIGLAVLRVFPSPFATDDVRFPSLAYRASPEGLANGEALLEALPSGRMLAPRELSVVLPMLSGRLRMTNFREFDAAPQLVLDGLPAVAADLTSAHDFVSGLPGPRGGAEALGRIAGRGLEYVVLSPAMADQASAVKVLNERGFHELAVGVQGYRVFGHDIR